VTWNSWHEGHSVQLTHGMGGLTLSPAPSYGLREIWQEGGQALQLDFTAADSDQEANPEMRGLVSSESKLFA
jgi:hypothetical protein